MQTEKLRRSRKEMSDELKRKQRTLQQVSAIIEGSPSVATLRSRFDREDSVPRNKDTFTSTLVRVNKSRYRL